jgi:hypothetical protein
LASVGAQASKQERAIYHLAAWLRVPPSVLQGMYIANQVDEAGKGFSRSSPTDFLQVAARVSATAIAL